MNEFSKNVHWTTATGISVVGILFFFLSKRLKKKEDLFITEKFGASTLSSPLYIDDSASLSIFDFKAKCKLMKQQKNIELIII
jgi:replicative DNA helicase